MTLAPVQANAPAPAPSPDLARLRRDFVSMLFALAAGQVAICAYAVIDAKPPAADNGVISTVWAAVSHLSLALLVIATSWIGWSRSMSAERGVQGVFDRDFPAWIIDVLLVTVYFFLVSSVEVKGDAEEGGSKLLPASVLPELRWTLWLLILYGIWDAFTKWFPRNRQFKLARWPLHCLAYTCASLASIGALLLIRWYVWGWVQSPGTGSCDALSALLIDIALMAVVVFFRVMKSAEVAWLEKRWKWRRPSGGEVEKAWLWKAVGLLVLAAICCALCYPV